MIKTGKRESLWMVLLTIVAALCLLVFGVPRAQAGVGPDVGDFGPASAATQAEPSQGEVRRDAVPASVLPRSEQRPLGAPVRRTETNNSTEEVSPAAVGGSVLRTILATLAVVVLIVGAALAVRRLAKNAPGLWAKIGPGGRAPSGVLEVLGRYPVGRGVTLILMRVDRRVLLLSQSAGRGLRGQATMTTLCEISEPEDVASILIKTRDDEGASMAQRFQAVLSEADRSASETLGEGVFEPEVVRAGAAGARPTTGGEAAAAIRMRLNSMRSGPKRGGGPLGAGVVA